MRGEVVGASKFVPASHISLEVALPLRAEPYTLIASTFAPGQLASFMLYVYSNQQVEILPCKEDDWQVEHQAQREQRAGAGGDLVVSRSRATTRRS